MSCETANARHTIAIAASRQRRGVGTNPKLGSVTLGPELQRSRREQGGLRHNAISVFHPFAYPTPGVARIDHFFHLKPVERSDRSSRTLDACIDLGAQGYGISGLGKLAFVSGLNATFGWNSADICGGPHDARTGAAARRCEVIAGDPKAAAHNDGEDRHRDLRECDHPLAALTDRTSDLVLETYRKTRIVDEVQNRKMKQVA